MYLVEKSSIQSPNFQMNQNCDVVANIKYREVQLEFTPDTEEFYMLFERCRTKDRKWSVKHFIHSGAATCKNFFEKCFLRVPPAVGLYCSCHAAQASKGNLQKTYNKTFSTSYRPRLYKTSISGVKFSWTTLYRAWMSDERGRVEVRLESLGDIAPRKADILFLKHDSSIFRQSSNPVCGFSMMEQVRLCAVWPRDNWFGSSMNHLWGWKTVWICYCHA